MLLSSSNKITRLQTKINMHTTLLFFRQPAG